MVLDLAHRLHRFCKDRSCWLLLLWGWHGQHDDWQTVIYYFALVQTRLGKSQFDPFDSCVWLSSVCVRACMHAWGSCWSEAHAGNLFTPARTLSKFRQPMAVSAMTELLAASASDFEILAVSANVFFAVIQWIPNVFFFLLLLLLVLVGILVFAAARVLLVHFSGLPFLSFCLSFCLCFSFGFWFWLGLRSRIRILRAGRVEWLLFSSKPIHLWNDFHRIFAICSLPQKQESPCSFHRRLVDVLAFVLETPILG